VREVNMSKLRNYLTEVKVKGGYDMGSLVIGYKEAKKLGIEKDVKQVYLMTTPLPKEETMKNIQSWESTGSQLVLSTKIHNPKYKEMVKKMLIKKWGKP
jgi:hypothetical protein